MKYFTEEWYRNTLVAQMCFQVRKDAKATKHSDKYFESLYSAQKSWYVKHLKRAAKHTKSAFDPAAAEAEFQANYEENLAFVRTSLPGEILEKVADVRVLALGCAEHTILMEITRYCGQVNRECERISEDYDAEVEKLADRLGWFKINSLNMLANAPVVSLDRQNSQKWVLTTSPEVTDIACELTLLSPEAVCGDADALIGATPLYFEILPAEQDGRMLFSLLCEQKDGKMHDISLLISDFEIAELK